MPDNLIVLCIYLFALGASFGSFCNMFVYRLPRHEGLGGHSYCDKTGKRLTWKDLIPIISYIIYKGRCRECGDKLPVKYPLIELSNALLFAGMIPALWALNLSIFMTVFIYIIMEIIFIFIVYLFTR